MSLVEEARQSAYVLEPSLTGDEYSEPDVFRLETAKIFRRRWLAVGREEAIPAVGDYLVQEIAGDGVVVMRQPGGELRAFFNTCRHRGSRLVEETGNAQ